MNPLSNLRVVELTEALAGPYCAMMLGDLGADVIKIERPGTGDQSRRWGARLPNDESAYFCSTNRNKRSLTLNIQSAAGREVMQKLLATADVFICNLPREDSLRRAGLDFETLHAKFPRLICVSVTGYGHSGPNAGHSGYDLVAQGEAGLMSITGTPESVPMRYPIPLADMTTGLYATIGILAALRTRDQTGQGQFVDLSLLESQAAYLTVLAGDFFATGQPPRLLGNAHPGIVPYQVFHTADKDVVIAVGSDRLWTQFCAVLGLGPDVRDDPRFATNQARLRNRAEVIEIVQARLAQIPSAELLPKLTAAEIPCGPINTVPDILGDAHYLQRGNIVQQTHSRAGAVRSIANPVRLTDTPPTYRLPPPALGEHTESILQELGYSPEEIEQLRGGGEV
jgi:crotonobetainyl-CoA:carnitine CoA-transferase CaiB-like acyl-CoA transferase